MVKIYPVETNGWVYYNPESGMMEWSANHPVRSDTMQNATNIKRMNQSTYIREYSQVNKSGSWKDK